MVNLSRCDLCGDLANCSTRYGLLLCYYCRFPGRCDECGTMRYGEECLVADPDGESYLCDECHPKTGAG